MANFRLKEKVKILIGWLLLAAGLFIIGWGLFSAYEIFSGKFLPPEIFKSKIEGTLPAGKQKAVSPEDQEKGILQEQLNKMLPPDLLPALFNLISWAIFVSLLVFGGYRTALLGIRLIK